MLLFTVILHITSLDYSWIKSQDICRKRKLCLQKLQRKLHLQLITKLKGSLLKVFVHAVRETV